MKVSDKKMTAAYSAIADPIMELRIRNRSENIDWDAELFQLQNDIWRQVRISLNIFSVLAPKGE